MRYCSSASTATRPGCYSAWLEVLLLEPSTVPSECTSTTMQAHSKSVCSTWYHCSTVACRPAGMAHVGVQLAACSAPPHGIAKTALRVASGNEQVMEESGRDSQQAYNKGIQAHCDEQERLAYTTWISLTSATQFSWKPCRMKGELLLYGRSQRHQQQLLPMHMACWLLRASTAGYYIPGGPQLLRPG